jgi:Leucine-rich repeat (LRR) protein
VPPLGHLPLLETLHLNDNRIATIHADAFAACRLLRLLDLSFNALGSSKTSAHCGDGFANDDDAGRARNASGSSTVTDHDTGMDQQRASADDVDNVDDETDRVCASFRMLLRALRPCAGALRQLAVNDNPRTSVCECELLDECDEFGENESG